MWGWSLTRGWVRRNVHIKKTGHAAHTIKCVRGIANMGTKAGPVAARRTLGHDCDETPNLGSGGSWSQEYLLVRLQVKQVSDARIRDVHAVFTRKALHRPHDLSSFKKMRGIGCFLDSLQCVRPPTRSDVVKALII